MRGNREKSPQATPRSSSFSPPPFIEKKRGKNPPPLLLTAYASALAREVERVLERVHRSAVRRHFFLLHRDVGVDQVIREDTATGQELAVLIEVSQGFREIAADRRDLGVLFGRQIVQVLISRIARVDLVLDAVETGLSSSRA